MAKKPLYKRLKYGNIMILILIIAFVAVMVSVIKNSSDDKQPQSSQAGGQSASDSVSPQESGSEASQPDMQNNNTVLGKIDFEYTKFSKSAMYEGLLTIVSDENRYAGASPSDCVSCYDFMFDSEGNKLFSIKSSEVSARSISLSAVRDLMAEFFKQFGQASLVLMDGYSSADSADDLSTGYTLNFRFINTDGTYTSFTPIGSYQWLADNAYRYGLIFRYPQAEEGAAAGSDRSGYIRYVGQPHAQIMYKNNMTLEKYVEYIKNYSYENAIAYTTDDGNNYAIYYCASEGEETNIKIPTDMSGTAYNYDISGNNSDGYIITVKLPQR